MLTLIALVISIVLQFVAAFIAIKLTKRTKYRLSWILISIGLLFMAIRRFLELVSYLNPETNENLTTFNNWLTVVTSFIVTAGVILISELFSYLGRVDKLRQDMEKNVLNAIIKTEESERKRFAGDLHDGLGPLLSSIRMSLSSLAETYQNLRGNDIFINTEKTINESIKTIKDISNNISPHILNNFGLHSAVKDFARKIDENKQVSIVFESNLQDFRFEENKEVMLYRIICELVNNTLKHAKASAISIILKKTGNQVQLVYTDDGTGFDVNRALTAENTGMGLSNMLSRVKSVKGSFSIFELVQGGMRAEVKIGI